MCSLACLEGKTKENVIFFILFLRSKPFCPFLENEKKNIYTVYIKKFCFGFIFGDCSLKYKEGFCKFSTKINNF